MASNADISAWIALFVGLYALAAGTGEFRNPNSWWAMLKEFERSPALRFVTGFVTLALGATIYLVNPWTPGDWLSIAVSIVGGIAVAEGLLMLASGERFLHLARMLLGRGGRVWAAFSVLLGVVAILVALSRLQAF
jgi:vacuolar-type H+-ATPase subunit I/STV1